MPMLQEKYYITFGDKSIADLGCYILKPGQFTSPERDVTVHEVPGRNGNIVIDNGRYKNVSTTYHIVVPYDGESEFLAKYDQLRRLFLLQTGYQELRDTYYPNEYRKAYVSGPMDVDRSNPKQGIVTVTFNCMPQRFMEYTGEISEYNRGYVLDYRLYETDVVYTPGTDRWDLQAAEWKSSNGLSYGWTPPKYRQKMMVIDPIGMQLSNATPANPQINVEWGDTGEHYVFASKTFDPAASVSDLGYYARGITLLYKGNAASYSLNALPWADHYIFVTSPRNLETNVKVYANGKTQAVGVTAFQHELFASKYVEGSNYPLISFTLPKLNAPTATGVCEIAKKYVASSYSWTLYRIGKIETETTFYFDTETQQIYSKSNGMAVSQSDLFALEGNVNPLEGYSLVEFCSDSLDRSIEIREWAI